MNWDVLARPDVAAALDGLAEAVGVRTPHGAWTVRGTAVEPGLAADVDYALDLSDAELVAATSRAELGPVDEAARFALLRALLGPVLLASAHHRHLWAWPWRTGVTLENLFHLTLRGSGGEPARFTWLLINQDWLWLEGHLGAPVRSVELDVESASELLRTVLRAMREHSVRAWLWFGPWWLQWRDAHSTLHADVPFMPVGEDDHGHDHDHDHVDRIGHHDHDHDHD